MEAAARAIPLLAVISLTTREQADEIRYCTIELDRALVSQAASSWQDAEGLPVEQWTFHYELIRWAYQPFMEGEPLQHYGWNLRRAEPY